ncbi:acetyl-CoA carboxylase biotin carboxyl carrier protein subunit [Ancylomarina salipaludis]|uniref:Acetyl-CoA carboxylase biotin carboxyl carrier protein subunit n=1 Tax=Ancylomarina salipaludis TaxID=2501299 RepID=A0A4Q1JNH0_9BACT|nr:acetyl-CoA carboxylase biotin carboxyl carrier protein subunit [Ancylomarina salipaludis]RXQ96228.1 acetyl-CoA carboxylase biotin carboxyl carrier protein subunit [Ancylomarina salipaludis]
MSLEIKLGDRTAKVELLAESGNQIKIMVDDNEYDLDCYQVEKGIYSILFKGRSYNVELIDTDSPKKYAVNTFYHSYDAEIIDAETKYLQARKGADLQDEQSTITSPMPGKVVKIPVNLGDEVKKGDTLIIISAMKMESEYKAGKDGIISEIFVNEDDTIKANQALVHIE